MTTSEDQHAVADTVARVFTCLDDKRFEEMGGYFTDDVAARTPGGTTQGRDAVVQHARRHHEHLARTQHLMTGAVVDVDGDRAQLRANQYATFADETGTPQMSLGIIYRAALCRTADRWRIASFGFDPVWTEERQVS